MNNLNIIVHLCKKDDKQWGHSGSDYRISKQMSNYSYLLKIWIDKWRTGPL